MKDPLQAQPTPYDVLGIDRGAGPADIDRAFKAGLTRGINPSKLTGAKKALERPVDRALLDMFQYDPAVLGRLRPDARGDPSCLSREARASTAEAWEAQLRRSFPDYGVAHALAVLWYWSALDAAERSLASGGGGGDASETDAALWEGAIAYWGMVLSSDDFWSSQTAVAGSVVSEVRRVLSERLPGDLQRFSQQHRDAGRQEWADHYRRLELVLATEVKTAKALAGAGYRTSAGPLWCGALMLGRLGLLESIRDQVAQDLAASPADDTLQSISRALSPHFRIAALIERKDPQGALDALDALPPGAKRSKEVKELRARALLERGRQEDSVGHTRDALKHWKTASECAPPADLARQIREAAAEAALTAAARLQARDRKEAIALLELAAAFAATEKVNRTLAELLTERGVETVVTGQKAFEKDPSATGAGKLAEAIEKGLADLDRGAALGSARAKEQADVARGLLRQLTGGMTPAVRHLVEEANQDAGRGDLGGAISNLRAALGMVTSLDPAHNEIRKMLSATLSGHAVSTVNGIMEGTANLDRDGVVAALQEALQELGEARSLDPTNKHAKENEKSLLDLMTKMGIPFFRGMPTPVTVEAAQREEDRHGLHATIVGIALVAAGIVGLMSFPGGAFGGSDGATNWVRSVAVASPLSPAFLWFGFAFGLVGAFLFLVLPLQTSTWGPTVLSFCTDRWWKKGAVSRTLEVAVFVYLALFGLSAYLYDGPPKLVELPPEEAATVVAEAPPPAAPTTPAPAATTPIGAASAAPSPAAASTEVAPSPAEALTVEAPSPTDASAEGVPELAWVSAETAPLDTVTAWLQRVVTMSDEARTIGLASLDSVNGAHGGGASQMITLLRAAVAEERGEPEAARSGYHQLLTVGAEGPYARTASLRLRVLDSEDEGALEKSLLAEGRVAGDSLWVRTAEGWTAQPQERAALMTVMALRSERATVRFWSFASRYAGQVPPARYLRLFGYILTAWILLKLPLFFRMGRLARVAPALAPRIARLQQEHKGDTATLTKKVQDAYAEQGVSLTWGCVHSLADLALVVLLYFTFRSYAPQLTLDGARFFWVGDLMSRDLKLIGVWALMGTLYMMVVPKVSQENVGVLALRTALSAGFFGAIAWFTHWPAWIVVFWTMLWGYALLIQAAAIWLERKEP